MASSYWTRSLVFGSEFARLEASRLVRRDCVRGSLASVRRYDPGALVRRLGLWCPARCRPVGLFGLAPMSLVLAFGATFVLPPLECVLSNVVVHDCLLWLMIGGPSPAPSGEPFRTFPHLVAPPTLFCQRFTAAEFVRSLAVLSVIVASSYGVTRLRADGSVRLRTEFPYLPSWIDFFTGIAGSSNRQLHRVF